MNNAAKIIKLVIDNGGNDMLLSKANDATRKMYKFGRYKAELFDGQVILEDSIDKKPLEYLDMSNIKNLSISKVFDAVDIKFSNDKYTYQLYIKNVIRNTKSISEAANDFIKCVFA
ncbi:hypothetical protein K413DRAFT_4661 [Clostridium sp. ASBs410]|nr:hypothetical protein K413DRAFT_4661 [Clostridium sp. ASBs410]